VHRAGTEGERSGDPPHAGRHEERSQTLPGPEKRTSRMVLPQIWSTRAAGQGRRAGMVWTTMWRLHPLTFLPAS
jgi:hypothetical protein